MNPRLLGIIGGVALVVALLSPFMMGSSKKVEQLFQDAEDLYGQADYEGAIAKYGEALEESTKRGVKTEVIDKDFPTLANYKIAVSYSRLAEQSEDFNYYDTSIEYIEKVAPTATIPKHQEGLTYLWGHILYRTEQFELAEPKFMQLIQNFPNSLFVENAWYAIGQLNYKLQNYEESRQAFKQVLDGFPNSEFKDDAQHLIAQSFLNETNYEQAYQEFDKIATEEFKNYPDLQAEAMYKAAYSLNQLGRDDESIGRYTNFITQFPESQYVTAAYFDQGAIYARQKDYDNARVNYELALQNTADRILQSEIQSAIGRTYYDQGDYENAIVSYTTLLEEYPESEFIAEAKLGIADSHFRLDAWSEASAAYERVINEHQDPDDNEDKDSTGFIPYCSYQIGESYYKLGTQQREAGESEQGTATLELALSWYQKTIDQFPEDPVAPHALYGAIWALNDLGRKEELETVAREFIDKNKNDNEFDILAAEVQLRFADIKRQEFKQYIEAAEEYAKLWEYRNLPKFHLVKLMGKFFEGRSYYEAATPEGYQEGDTEADFNTDYLQRSVAAYQDAIGMFNDDAFLPGVAEERYDDFPERIAQVEACIMNEALSHEMLGDWQQARNRYASIPETSEYYERALLLVANSYVKEGDKEGAINYYNSVLDKLANDDNRSLAEIKLADLLRAEKRYQEAALQYQAVVDGNPTGEYADDALYLVGLCYYHASADDASFIAQAETAFQRVISEYENSPNAIEAYYGLALAYRDAAQKHGDTEKWPLVMQVAEQANEKYMASDNEPIQRTLGQIELIKVTAIENTTENVDIDSLVVSLKRIVDNVGAPEEARSRSQLKIGHTYYGAKRYDEALAEYLSFVETFPQSELAANAQYQAAVCYYQIAQAAADQGTKQLALQNTVSTAQKVATLTDDADNRISASYTEGLAKIGLEDPQGAADAFKQVTALEGQTEDENRKTLIFQAHSRLAELNGTLGNHADAVKEYQYIIENTENTNLKGRSYFAMAFALDEQLQNYTEALMGYQNAIELVNEPIIQAQAYYRIGLTYQERLKEADKALNAFQTLITEHSGSTDASIASMVADAGIRRSTLYVETGRLNEAIAEAVEALDRTKANPKATVSEKVAAQYNLGFLYSDKARSLFSTEAGTDLQPYIDASRQAAGAFFEVNTLASPVEQAHKETVIPYVQNALFQAGQIYYSVGTGVTLQEDLISCLTPLTTFVSYADKGLFAKSDSANLTKNTETSLTYLASANFELGRMQVGLDGEMSEKAVSYFVAAADAFRDMVRRYPSANDAALWQYQVGESYYASQQYETAIAEYDKVRAVNKTHKSAAESLYAISTCYQLLAEAAEKAGDEDAKQQWYDRLFAANETLAADYPNSIYTADALINIGNKYYNAGSEADLDQSERISLYQMAIDHYSRALESPGISAESKGTALSYLNDTASALAYYEYDTASTMLNEAKLARGEEQKPAVLAAVDAFKQIVEKYPNTKYGDLGLGQIGDAYMVLTDQEDTYFNEALHYFNLLWAKYETSPPVDSSVQNALRYAQRQVQAILNYMKEQNIPKRDIAGGE